MNMIILIYDTRGHLNMLQHEWKINPKDTVLVALLLTVLLALFLINPETIPAGGGFGFDGVTYARMVAEIDIMISEGELSEYYAQRIAPSLMVRGALTTLDLPLDAANIINGFRVLNGLLMIVAVGFWMAIAQCMRLTAVGFWVGIAGIVLTFPNAKQLFYYPVLTDTFAFTIGLAMVWAHLTGRIVLITIIAIVGAFAWQMAGLIGMALVASTLVTNGMPQKAKVNERAGRFIVIIIMLSALSGLAIGLPHILGFNLEQIVFGQSFVSDPFLLLLTNIPALALSACFVFYLLVTAATTRWEFQTDLRQVAIVIVLLISISIIPNSVVSTIANPDIPPPGISGYIEILKALLIVRVREGLVLLSIVSHAVYYGPVFLLFLLLWRRVAHTTVTLGAGFLFVIAVFSILSVFSESRFTFMLWPFLVTVVCKVVSETRLPRLTQGCIAIGAVGFSKAWLTINQGPWPKPDFEALFEWPKSVYFSSLGPWMTVQNYIIQGVIVTLLFALIYATMKWGNAPHSISSREK